MHKRSQKILDAIIKEYLSTGQAVSSSLISRKYSLDLSPATIRIILSELERSGLLYKPHTSAGRIPTNQGMKFFVESMLNIETLSLTEKDTLIEHYSSLAVKHEVFQAMTSLLSDLSQNTVVMLTPSCAYEKVEQIEFLVLPHGILAVLINNNGRIYHCLLEKHPQISDSQIQWMHSYLNELLKGQTLGEIRQFLKKDLSSHTQLEKLALHFQSQVMPQEWTEVIVKGQSHLVSQLINDFYHPIKVSELLKTLEDKQVLLQLLDSLEDQDKLQVFIGDENPLLPKFSSCALVTIPLRNAHAAPLSQPGAGLLGIVGSVRMDYSRMIALVDFTAQLLSESLPDERKYDYTISK